MRSFIASLIFFLFSSSGFSQNILELKVPAVIEEQSLEIFFGSLEKEMPIRFFFKPEWLTGLHTTVGEEKTLGTFLAEQLSGTGIGVAVVNNYSIILTKDPNMLVEKLLTDAYVKKKSVKKLEFGTPTGIIKSIRLKGKIITAKTDDPANEVNVTVDNGVQRATTDANGRYEIVIPSGNHVVTYSHLSFEDQIIDLGIYEDATLDIVLNETPFLLDEVVIVDQATRNVSTRSLGLTSIKPVEMKRSPTFLGEIDVIKQIQTQPGVTTVGEGASGYNVRGGSVDQNLVLLDGTPVFNVSHAFGFFSSFNSNVVKSIDFYRGGIPAEYGGRASSVLSVVTREGDPNRWHGAGGIGILTSHMAIEGPIKKDTTTVFASFRSTYSDWVLKAINGNYANIRNSSVNFNDGTFKLAHKFSTRSKLVIAAYASHDEFRLTNDTTYSWSNLTASVRYDHAFNERWLTSALVSFGQYGYQVEDHDPVLGFRLNYNIQYPALRWDWNYTARTHKLSFGLQSTYYNFSPGKLTPSVTGSTLAAEEIDHEAALESALYASDVFYASDKLEIEPGLRLSSFYRIGPGDIYQYQPGQPINNFTRTDTLHAAQGEIMKNYFGLEPRLSVRYALTEDASIKAGYNRVYQYLHLISNTASVAAVDIWQLSNSHLAPQVADQVSAGYFRQTKNSGFEWSVEAFYKTIQNILDYKDGENLILNPALETAVLPGHAKSYGIELTATKLSGRLTGSVNYTFSRSFRQVNGNTASEKINNGNYYPSSFDQPHIFNINWRMGITKRIFFSGLFTYHTGRPVSLPVAVYAVDGVSISNFSERNQFRIPDYHRLDVAFVFEGNHKRKKPWTGSWILSCYNLYGRKNAYSVFFMDTKLYGLGAYKLSVIGSAVPSITYNFKF